MLRYRNFYNFYLFAIKNVTQQLNTIQYIIILIINTINEKFRIGKDLAFPFNVLLTEPVIFDFNNANKMAVQSQDV